MYPKLLLAAIGLLATASAELSPTDPYFFKNNAPQPNAVIPAPRQLAYQQLETIAFAHFGVNTFTDKEWGDGSEDPQIFNPTQFDARQWVNACKEAGLTQLILTAKHHDGFCLWPSQYTDHSVKSSPWKGGKGDMVKEVADACREGGIKFGLYLSPWDQHEPSYGTNAYNSFYLNQLRELLTNYGEISEVWMDGAKGENARDMEYDFVAWRKLIRELQPSAVIFSDAGPDVRWIGNEKGIAGETNWSTITNDNIEIGKPGQEAYLNTGDPQGKHWIPGECDVSVRPGWFYHASEDDQVKSLSHLLDIYYKSVGRNGVLLLNIPPDRRGLFHENDVARLKEFRSVLNETFQTNLARNKKIEAGRSWSKSYPATSLTDGDASTYWAAEDGVKNGTFVINLGRATRFDRVMLQEPVAMGQRVESFTVEARVNGQWQEIANGTTIGYKRLLRFPAVQADQVRVTVRQANNTLLLSEIAVFKASAREGEVAN